MLISRAVGSSLLGNHHAYPHSGDSSFSILQTVTESAHCWVVRPAAPYSRKYLSRCALSAGVGVNEPSICFNSYGIREQIVALAPKKGSLCCGRRSSGDGGRASIGGGLGSKRGSNRNDGAGRGTGKHCDDVRLGSCPSEKLPGSAQRGQFRHSPKPGSDENGLPATRRPARTAPAPWSRDDGSGRKKESPHLPRTRPRLAPCRELAGGLGRPHGRAMGAMRGLPFGQPPILAIDPAQAPARPTVSPSAPRRARPAARVRPAGYGALW